MPIIDYFGYFILYGYTIFGLVYFIFKFYAMLHSSGLKNIEPRELYSISFDLVELDQVFFEVGLGQIENII